MTIELTPKAGPFQGRPWLDFAVSTMLVAILALIAESIGVIPQGSTIWILPFLLPLSAFYAWRRNQTPLRVRRITLTNEQADQIKTTIADGTDDQAMKRATLRLQSEGFKKSEAELAVLHFFNQVNPARLRLMSPYFETREIHEESPIT
jgi:hypothetical protein